MTNTIILEVTIGEHIPPITAKGKPSHMFLKRVSFKL